MVMSNADELFFCGAQPMDDITITVKLADHRNTGYEAVLHSLPLCLCLCLCLFCDVMYYEPYLRVHTASNDDCVLDVVYRCHRRRRAERSHERSNANTETNTETSTEHANTGTYLCLMNLVVDGHPGGDAIQELSYR